MIVAGKPAESENTGIKVIVIEVVGVNDRLAFRQTDAVNGGRNLVIFHKDRGITERHVDFEGIIAVRIGINTAVTLVQFIISADILFQGAGFGTFVVLFHGEIIAQTQTLDILAVIGLDAQGHHAAAVQDIAASLDGNTLALIADGGVLIGSANIGRQIYSHFRGTGIENAGFLSSDLVNAVLHVDLGG